MSNAKERYDRLAAAIQDIQDHGDVSPDDEKLVAQLSIASGLFAIALAIESLPATMVHLMNEEDKRRGIA